MAGQTEKKETPFERLSTLMGTLGGASIHAIAHQSFGMEKEDVEKRYYNALADVYDFLDGTPMHTIMREIALEMDKGKKYLPRYAWPEEITQANGEPSE